MPFNYQKNLTLIGYIKNKAGIFYTLQDFFNLYESIIFDNL